MQTQKGFPNSSIQASLHNVSVNYGRTQALTDISLEVRAGDVLGLVGANGAGKSTALGLLHGGVLPSRGRVTVLGGDPRDPRHRINLGTTPQSVSLPESLKVSELISLVSAHFRLPTPADELAEEFGIVEYLGKRAGGLSGGQQRAVAVALAFVGNPTLVLLDEPTAGLDVSVRRSLRQAVAKRNAEGCAVILTSHYLEDLEELATRLVILERGMVRADDSAEQIIRQSRGTRISFRTAEPAFFEGIGGVLDTSYVNGRMVLTTREPDSVLHALYASEARLEDVEVHRGTLEDALAALTKPVGDATREGIR